MTDLGIDENFHIRMAENGDIAVVEDIEEFEQTLALTVTDYFFEHIGDRNTPSSTRRLRMAARRAAESNDFVTSIQSVDVEAREGDKLYLEIKYNYDQNFEFEVV